MKTSMPAKRNRRIAIFAGVILLILAGAGYLWKGTATSGGSGAKLAQDHREAGPARPTEKGKPVSNTAQIAGPQSSPVIAGAAPSQPLPLPDTPLASVYEDLKRQVANGNERAACRLAAELNRCRNLDVLASTMAADKAELDKLTPDTPAYAAWESRVRVARAQHERAARTCEGVPRAETGNAWKYLLVAADRGHVPSMTRFVIDPPLSEEQFMADLDAWQAYRQFAPRFLEAAVSKGDPAALKAYAGLLEWRFPGPGGGRLLQRDPVRAYAMELILLQIVDEPTRREVERGLQRLGTEIGSDGIARARSQAAALAPKFGGVRNANFDNGLTLGDALSECQD